MKSRCLHHRQEFLMYNCYPAERFTETITILPIRRNHVSSLRPRPAFWLDIQSKQSSWSGFHAVSVKKEITESVTKWMSVNIYIIFMWICTRLWATNKIQLANWLSFDDSHAFTVQPFDLPKCLCSVFPEKYWTAVRNSEITNIS